MSLYLGNKKVAPIVKVSEMQRFLQAGGKFGQSNIKDFSSIIDAQMFKDITNFNYMFYNCRYISTIPFIDTSSATTMDYMFHDCYVLTSVPELDTSKVISMTQMFYGCDGLTSIPLFNTSKAVDMAQMFAYCSNITEIPAFDCSSVKNMTNMFNNCASITKIHMKNISASINLSSCTKMTRDALLEVLNNLNTVTLSYKLTLGTTLLAKLTEEDKAIATNKGWTLQ